MKEHVKTTGSPQANGQVERTNRIKGPMIAKLAIQKSILLGHSYEDVDFSLNNTKQRSRAQMSSKMLFGSRKEKLLMN